MSEQLVVNGGLFSKYKNINAAMSANHDSKEILIKPGIYRDNILLNRSVEIINTEETEKVVLKVSGQIGIEMATHFVKISNITIQHSGLKNQESIAFKVFKGKLILENCVIISDVGIGILASNPETEVIMRNCIIKNTKHHAISAHKGANLVLEDCEISNTENPGLFLSGSKLSMKNGQIYNNKTNGAIIEKGTYAVFEGVKIHNNDYPGVWIGNYGSKALFKNCTIQNGKNIGIKVEDKGQAIIENCKIFGNKEDGIHVNNQASVSIENSWINDNLKNGVKAEGNSSLTVNKCEFFGNSQGQILLNNSININISATKFRSGDFGVILTEKASCIIAESDFFNLKEMGVQSTKGAQAKLLNSNFDDLCHGVVARDKGKVLIEKCEFANNEKVAVIAEFTSHIEVKESRFIEGNIGIAFEENSEGVIDHCKFHEQKNRSIAIQGGSNPIINNCIITNGGEVGISIYENGKGEIKDSRIQSNLVGIKIEGGSNFTAINCDVIENHRYGVEILEYSEIKVAEIRFDNNAENVSQKNDSNFLYMEIPTKEKKPDYPITKTENQDFNQVLKELNSLIGMDNIKKDIEETILTIEVLKERALLSGKTVENPFQAGHIVLLGNPGTGKTTVARLFGKLYKSMGLLPTDKVVQVTRGDLVGEYIGQTEQKTNEKITEAMGGILFIDEAYSLHVDGSGNDFGSKAITALLESMENYLGKFVVIVAGYEKEMKSFIESNPGLKSRFTNYYTLDDYTPAEMIEIAKKMSREEDLTFKEDALSLLLEEFELLWRKRDRFFSNARTVRNYIKRINQVQTLRIGKTPKNLRTKELMFTIIAEDVQAALPSTKVKSYNLPINKKMLEEALNELHSLIGMDEVKTEIDKLVTLVKYYKETGKNLKNLSPHTILKGNPGTGKTVTARIIAKIYESLGILERGDLVEIKRDDIVSSAGVSEDLIAKYIEEAMGGVLFIDEAYQLTQYGASDPGHRAIEVLLKEMEDKRGQFIVIAAGYKNEMDQFLASNAGLDRRFERQIEFDDYTPDELMQIANLLLSKANYKLDGKAILSLYWHFEDCYNNRDQTFGNGGLVRNVITDAIRNTDFRVARTPQEARNIGEVNTITEEDLNFTIGIK